MPQKKTAAAIQQVVSAELDTLLKVLCAGQRQTGSLDLEAIETATRNAMHRAGAALLSRVLSQGRPHFTIRWRPWRLPSCAGSGH